MPTPPATTRPVPRPPSDDPADVLARHAQNPSAFLALNRGTEHFRLPGVDGLVAFRPAGRRLLVQLGGPFAAEHDQDRLLAAFVDHARRGGRRVLAVQLERADAEQYARHGFRVNQVGSSYALDLGAFTLAGGAFVQLRNKVSRARRCGVEVVEVGVDVPAGAGLDAALDGIDRAWLAGKGAAAPLRFLVGERGGPAGHLRRLFIARLEGVAVGYLSLSPVHGRRAGWLHDLSRRLPHAPPGVTELVVLTAAERLRADGHRWLHFGFTPFTGLAPEHRITGAGSPAVDRAVDLLARHGEAVYPAASQVAYKLKWRPQLVQPEYVAMPGRVRPGAVWQLLRLTGAI
jgi:lysylphosphatidylglycerol synthetase-like protein (DUF2156 family)